MHPDHPSDYETVRAVLNRHASSLKALPGVEAVGIAGDAQEGYAISLRTRNLTEATRRQLPQTLDGYPVVIEDLGTTIICPNVADD